MAVRQYVGARYVPKFADPVAWQAGTSYEALTIVTYNNSSYTSKIPVPATVGNPADNSEYWVLTGNYNAQVEAYREETVAVQENLNEEITNREEADTTLTNNLASETQARENADNTLTETVNKKKLKTKYREIICIGDSYGQGVYDGTSHIVDAWPTKLSTLTGANCYNYCVSRAAFQSTDVANYLEQITNAHNEHPNADCIICAGFTNEPYFSTSTLYNSVNSFIQYCKNNFDADIYLIYGNLSYNTSNTNWRNLKKICEHSIQTACVNNGVYFSNISTFLRAVPATCSSDLTHLTAKGYLYFAYAISLILNGITPHYRSEQYTLDVTEGISNHFFFIIDENELTIYFPFNGQINSNLDSALHCNGSNALIELTLAPDMDDYLGLFTFQTFIQPFIPAGNTTTGNAPMQLLINFYNGIKLYPYCLKNGGVDGFNDISSGTSYTFIPTFKISIPTTLLC